MTQPIAEEYFESMDNLDFTLSSRSIQPSSPTEESGFPVRYDYSTSESFYEIDVADLNMTLYPDQDFRNLINEFGSLEQLAASSPIPDELNELLTEVTEIFHSTESNDMTSPIQSTDEQLAMIKSGDSGTLPVIRPHMEKLRIKNLSDQSISLSNSVAVTVPTPNQLQLVHPLEDTYRPRYKSDYFPQKGAVRRPRYVADNVGNHFVTLQLPAGYNRDIRNEFIRISLITTSINNRGHFYSPYKFQTDHNDFKVLDQNPMYLPVQSYRGRDSSLKLHLVLIKSKLDQLNDAQPLKPFLDTIGSVQNIISEGKLSPKELITKYQLEKSHIAFTLCTKVSKDTYKLHPETTIISSVITELPPKQSVASKKTKPETNTANTGKKISCPNCSHCFDLPDGEVAKGEKRKSSSSTSQTSSKLTTNSRTNKKKKAV